MGFFLLLCHICGDVECNVFRILAIRVNFDVVVAMHCSQYPRTVSVDIPICPLWAPIAACVNVVIIAQRPQSSSLAA